MGEPLSREESPVEGEQPLERVQEDDEGQATPLKPGTPDKGIGI